MTDRLASNEALIAATIGIPSTRGDFEPLSLGDDAERMAVDVRNAIVEMGCKERDGYPGAISEFGVPYRMIRFGVWIGDGASKRARTFVRAIVEGILKQGADTLVWRARPEVTRGRLTFGQPEIYQVYMRLHGLYSGVTYDILQPSCEGGVTLIID